MIVVASTFRQEGELKYDARRGNERVWPRMEFPERASSNVRRRKAKASERHASIPVSTICPPDPEPSACNQLAPRLSSGIGSSDRLPHQKETRAQASRSITSSAALSPLKIG